MLENLRLQPDRRFALEHYRELAPGYDASCRAVARKRAGANVTLIEAAAEDARLERYCPDFRPVASNFVGTSYLGVGTFTGEASP